MALSTGRKKVSAGVSAALQRKLSLYAIAASAAGVELLALQPAEGEVVYTPTHEIIGRNQSFNIDLNHDGIADFTIQNVYRKTSSRSYQNDRLQVLFGTSAAVVYDNQVSEAAVLKKGALVGPRSPLCAGGIEILAERFTYPSAGTYSYGYWFNASSKYLGFRFKIDGQVHYGWARLSISSKGFKMAVGLTGYAYETEANTPILAGDIANESGGKNAALPQRDMQSSNERSAGTLAALSLGNSALSIWRREEMPCGYGDHEI